MSKGMVGRLLSALAEGDVENMVITIGPSKGQLATDLDILWLLLGAYLVFFMQCGFALLEAGSVRAKNTKNILLKNVLDACVGALVWWSWGYSFAYGENGALPNEFIGGTNFFMANSDDVSPDPAEKESGFNNASSFFAFWMFQWAFAATAATIVSGAVAERCQFQAYLTYTFVLTGLVYPVVVHWVWSAEGWLSAFRDKDGDGELDILFDQSLGMVDFAGSGVVHMTGGGAALMAAIVLGPRYGRFGADGSVIDLPGSSVALSTLGVLILWFGWYGFNPVSTLVFYGSMYVASKCAVTTTLAAAAGGVTVLVVDVGFGNPPDVAPALNGILAGLVSITAGCSVVEPYAAAAIGVVGGLVYYFASMALKKMQIDDPLDASPVHFFSGIWGVISVGLFATPANLLNAYGSKTDVGLLYGGNGAQLGVQLLGAASIAVWTCGISFVLFLMLKVFGILRVPQEEEITGLDISHHGGAAYNFEEPKNNIMVSVQSTADTASFPSRTG